MRRSLAHAGATVQLHALSVATIATRAYVLAVGLCATLLLGFPDDPARPTPSSTNPVLDLPLRWDTEWYVDLARDGYRWDGGPGVLENIAFFPAYPLALRLVAWVTGAADSAVRWNWTGVVLSMTFLVAALWFLARLGDVLLGATTGQRAALLCLVYPWSIYFGLPYTESLFLLACCAATYRYVTGRHMEAFIWALVAGLTRPNGILLSALFGLLWLRDAYALRSEIWPSARSEDCASAWMSVRSEGHALAWTRVRSQGDASALTSVRSEGHASAWPGQLLRGALPIVGPLVGIAIYSVYVHGMTGDPLTWLSAQKAWGRPAMDPVYVLTHFVLQLVVSPIAMAREHPYTVANGITGLLALALVVPVGRRVGWAFAAFVFLGVVMPVASGGLTSLGRYTAILFPIFLYLARTSRGPAFIGLVSLSLVAQGLVSALFFTWRPVY